MSPRLLRRLTPALGPARRSSDDLATSQPAFFGSPLHGGDEGVYIVVMSGKDRFSRAANFCNEGTVILFVVINHGCICISSKGVQMSGGS